MKTYKQIKKRSEQLDKEPYVFEFKSFEEMKDVMGYRAAKTVLRIKEKMKKPCK